MGSIPFLLKLLAGKDLLGHLEVIFGIFPPAYSHVPCPATLRILRSGCLAVCKTLRRMLKLQTSFLSSVHSTLDLPFSVCLARVLPSAWHLRVGVLCSKIALYQVLAMTSDMWRWH